MNISDLNYVAKAIIDNTNYHAREAKKDLERICEDMIKLSKAPTKCECERMREELQEERKARQAVEALVIRRTEQLETERRLRQKLDAQNLELRTAIDNFKKVTAQL